MAPDQPTDLTTEATPGLPPNPRTEHHMPPNLTDLGRDLLTVADHNRLNPNPDGSIWHAGVDRTDEVNELGGAGLLQVFTDRVSLTAAGAAVLGVQG